MLRRMECAISSLPVTSPGFDPRPGVPSRRRACTRLSREKKRAVSALASRQPNSTLSCPRPRITTGQFGDHPRTREHMRGEGGSGSHERRRCRRGFWEPGEDTRVSPSSRTRPKIRVDPRNTPRCAGQAVYIFRVPPGPRPPPRPPQPVPTATPPRRRRSLLRLCHRRCGSTRAPRRCAPKVSMSSLRVPGIGERSRDCRGAIGSARATAMPAEEIVLDGRRSRAASCSAAPSFPC